jgi:hypothetical protein
LFYGFYPLHGPLVILGLITVFIYGILAVAVPDEGDGRLGKLGQGRSLISLSGGLD